MPKVVATKGLPGSSKTTWARNYIANASRKTKRCNKDDLRAMLDNGKHTRANEKFILTVRDKIVVEALQQDIDIIVDDTNLAPKHEARLRQLAQENNAGFEIVDFTDVPIETCIKNDLKRFDSVGEAVIRQMAAQYGIGYEEYVPEGDQPAIVVDLDGSLAHRVTDRSPYDWQRVGEDVVDENIKQLIECFIGTRASEPTDDGLAVILLSGRDGEAREETEKWLTRNSIPYTDLFMRAEGDNRKDTEIKRELFDEHVRPYYDVRLVIDDRPSVAREWRRMGLTVWQVADPHLEF